MVTVCTLARVFTRLQFYIAHILILKTLIKVWFIRHKRFLQKSRQFLSYPRYLLILEQTYDIKHLKYLYVYSEWLVFQKRKIKIRAFICISAHSSCFYLFIHVFLVLLVVYPCIPRSLFWIPAYSPCFQLCVPVFLVLSIVCPCIPRAFSFIPVYPSCFQ